MRWIKLDDSVFLNDTELAVEVLLDDQMDGMIIRQVGVLENGQCNRRVVTDDEAAILISKIHYDMQEPDYSHHRKYHGWS